MFARHFEFLVEDQSMEAFLSGILPKMVSGTVGFTIHSHQGKVNLLNKLASRLKGYTKWLPEGSRIVVVVDRDKDECGNLKDRLERICMDSGLRTRKSTGGADWQIAARI